MRRPMSVLALLLVAVVVRAAEFSYPVSQARVTHDAGTQGNVGHGNLPNPGDEVGWTLPDDVPVGVYRVTIDGRTGDRGEGTSFVAGYRLLAPDRAFAGGTDPHEVTFSWPRGQRPSVRSKGIGYSVFQGEMVAGELLYLRPGDLVRVHGASGWSMVWRLVLRGVGPAEQVACAIEMDELAGIASGETTSLRCGLTNWRSQAARWMLVLEVVDSDGNVLHEHAEDVTIAPRSAVLRPVPVPRQRFGPLWAKLGVRENQTTLTEAVQGLCFSPAPAAKDVAEDSPFGIHKGDLSRWPAIGAKWVRLWDTGDTWNRYERQRGVIEWEGLDTKVAQAEGHGVRILYVFAYTPTWASARPDEPHYTGRGARAEARDLADWARFVEAVVGRYRGRVDVFEVWNEPNAGFFSGTVDAYVQLLGSAYAAAKRANPDCTVVGVSGTGSYLGWLEDVLERDGLRYMDAVSVHTYTTPRSPEKANLLGRMQTTRELITKHGGQHPIWNTEVGIWQPEREGWRPLTEEEIHAKAPEETRPNWKAGWPFRPISELEAARHCVRMYVLSLASGVERLFWYAWYTTSLPMFTVNNAPRFMTCAYAAMAAKLDGAEFTDRITLGTADVHICLFRRADDEMAVAWSTRRDGREVEFRADGTATVSDMWGNGREQAAGVVRLSPSPVYVEGLTAAELRSVRLSGETLVFESPTAKVTADLGEKNVKEHTSPPHHGARRVMGLPDAGDEITWLLEGISPGRYDVELDGFTGWKAPTNHVGHYVVAVRPRDGAPPLRVALSADPERSPQKVGDIRHYGVMVGREPVPLKPGATVSVSSSTNWGFVGPLTLKKVAEIGADEPVLCPRVPLQPRLDGRADEWAGMAPLAVDARKQAAIGVADAFASTNEHDSWRGGDDLSAEVWTGWDGDSLWVCVSVVDDVLRPEPAGGAWNGDCVEVFLDLRGPDDVGSAVITDDVYQVFCVAPEADGRTQPPGGRTPEGVEARSGRTENGWTVELRVPLAGAARFPLAAGQRLGFDIAIDDADNVGGERAVRKTQMVWHGTANNFEDPSVYGTLVLGE